MTVGTHTGPRIRVTGAAGMSAHAVLSAPRRRARVLAAFPAAVYLQTVSPADVSPRAAPPRAASPGTDSPPGEMAGSRPAVVAVITGAATLLPNAVLIAGALPEAEVGDEAWVGGGAVEVGGWRVRVSRWWDPGPPLPRVAPQALPAVLPGLPAGGLAGNPALVRLAEATRTLADVECAAEGLVGLGPGLTPSGDDVLAGLLVALRALGTAAGVSRAVPLADRLATAVVRAAATRTTAISAALLDCAARGDTCPEVTAVLRALTGHGRLGPALTALCRLGHTSGADLAQGLSIGLASVHALAETSAHAQAETLADVQAETLADVQAGATVHTPAGAPAHARAGANRHASAGGGR
ncbi:DUF2877 domain-containing protein [Nonomuraea longicatena]|uniref:DUF2877 domain-containing protein n=1 Tax=Nonomuraea longicatena TaxID=83682 RepID=A0ABP3Z4U4_9ACTN